VVARPQFETSPIGQVVPAVRDAPVLGTARSYPGRIGFVLLRPREQIRFRRGVMVRLKKAIVKFVSDTTTLKSPDSVPVEGRVTTFDNDRPLWTEQPIYTQFAFALDRKALAPEHPEWKQKQPFRPPLRATAKLSQPTVKTA
jgi:hypothetical protein